MFSVDDRERVRDRVLEWASSDPRIVAGAVVGSMAQGERDRWSDLDLTFAVVRRCCMKRTGFETWLRPSKLGSAS